jgi:hypothetical protein
MTNQHPITPPPELVQQWWEESNRRQYTIPEAEEHVVSMAAQWGADHELEVCCEWIAAYPWLDHPELLIKQLRAARRPKPPSLKELALAALDDAILRGDCITTSDALPAIRHALDQLDD